MSNLINSFKNVLVEECPLGHLDSENTEVVIKRWAEEGIDPGTAVVFAKNTAVWVQGDPDTIVSLDSAMNYLLTDAEGWEFCQVQLPADYVLYRSMRSLA